jgi:hypothetical protein
MIGAVDIAAERRGESAIFTVVMTIVISDWLCQASCALEK